MSLLRRIMGKLFFVRRTENDLLKEQNLLLSRLLEASQRLPQVVVNTVAAPLSPSPLTAAEKVVLDEEDRVDDSVTTFVPKITKATKSEVSNMTTSAESFSSDSVDKLRKAKEAAAGKKGE